MSDCIHGKKNVLGQEKSKTTTFKVKQLTMTLFCLSYELDNTKMEYPEDMVYMWKKIFISSYLFHE